MRALGYETEDVKGGVVNGAMVHGVLDLLYHLRRWPGRLVRSSGEAAKAFLGSLRGRAGEKTDLRR
jgi:translation initiation factor 2 gamma subunit (eIF-2gamma)